MKRILCFGDSNTYGYIPGTGKRYNSKERWTGILQQSLQNKEIEIIEEGVVGRTTVYEDSYRPGLNGSKLLPTALQRHGTIDTVVLMLGTNDCKTIYHATPEEIGAGIEQLIKQIKSTAPNTKILLVSPILLGERVWEKDFDPEFNKNSVQVSKGLKKVYSSLAHKYGADFLAASDYAAPSEVDQEHLTIEGHRNLADALTKKLSA